MHLSIYCTQPFAHIHLAWLHWLTFAVMEGAAVVAAGVAVAMAVASWYWDVAVGSTPHVTCWQHVHVSQHVSHIVCHTPIIHPVNHHYMPSCNITYGRWVFVQTNYTFLTHNITHQTTTSTPCAPRGTNVPYPNPQASFGVGYHMGGTPHVSPQPKVSELWVMQCVSKWVYHSTWCLTFVGSCKRLTHSYFLLFLTHEHMLHLKHHPNDWLLVVQSLCNCQ